MRDRMWLNRKNKSADAHWLRQRRNTKKKRTKANKQFNAHDVKRWMRNKNKKGRAKKALIKCKMDAQKQRIGRPIIKCPDHQKMDAQIKIKRRRALKICPNR